MAQQTYQSLGIQGNVKLAGYRESVARIMPGDLVGWNGGDSPDGSYVGNVAIYAGNREIVENFYGTVRRRKLTPQDNVFGLPVIHPGDQQQEM
jgi:cell wall-associated NlpC family hydrolase